MANPLSIPQKAYGRRSGVRDDQQRELAEYQQKLSMGGNVDQPLARSGEPQVAQQLRTGLAGSLHDSFGGLATGVPAPHFHR